MKYSLVLISSLLLAATLSAEAQTKANRSIQITSDFDGISVAGGHQVHFETGNQGEPITVIGSSKDIDNLKVYVKNGTLHITYPKNYRNGSRMEVYVRNPVLNSAAVAGSGAVNTTGKLNPGNKKFSVAGSGKVNIESAEGGKYECSVAGSGTINCKSIDGDEVAAKISGSGKVTVAGTVNRLSASIAGSGRVNAEELTAKEGSIKIAGSGRVECRCTEILKASVNGSGKVNYYGRPQNVKFSGKTGNIQQK